MTLAKTILDHFTQGKITMALHFPELLLQNERRVLSVQRKFISVQVAA